MQPTLGGGGTGSLPEETESEQRPGVIDGSRTKQLVIHLLFVGLGDSLLSLSGSLTTH